MAVNTLQEKLKTDRGSVFQQITDRISAIASKYDVKIIGYRSLDLPYFSALSLLQQEEIIVELKTFLNSMEVTEGVGQRLDSQKQALWCALSSLGLVPPSDLFSHIDENKEVIEIYNLKGLQIWRNFNFFDICSYTLEEIYSIDWCQRYSRSEEKTVECQQKVEALLVGKTADLYFAEIDDHEIEETCSCLRFVVTARHNVLCRLRDKKGQVAAWMVVSKAKLVRRLKFRELPALQALQSPLL